jgi:YbbR domain-containing protein
MTGIIKWIKEVPGYMNLDKLKNDRRIVVFAICLFIASALWFLDALGKNYMASLFYPVKYINPPENLFLASTPPSRIELKVEAHGFTLLRHKLSFVSSPIILNINTIRENNPGTGKSVTIQSESLVRRISEQISQEITVTGVSPGSITLNFDTLDTKTLPVRVDVDLELRSQFYLSGVISTEPESLRISGPASVLDTLEYVITQPRQFKALDASVIRQIPLVQPENTRLSTEVVQLNIPVERFTEKEFKIPVQVRNKPEGVKVKLFPSEVQVSFLVSLSRYESITAFDFKAFVDYEDARINNETLDVTLETQPSFIEMVRFTPASVEFLIEPE